jgi:hypothetical protein
VITHHLQFKSFSIHKSLINKLFIHHFLKRSAYVGVKNKLDNAPKNPFVSVLTSVMSLVGRYFSSGALVTAGGFMWD